MAVKVKSERKN